MESLLQDLRYAARLLRRSPAFTIAAVLTLALGMGANTVMFSVLNTVLLRPLPYPHPERLVQIWETDTRRGDSRGVVSPYDFLEWRKHSNSFEQIATYDYNSTVLSSEKEPHRLSTLFVTASFFDVLGVAPIKGRTFLPDEDSPDKPRVAVLSYAAWSRYFGNDPNILGRSVVLDEQSYSIIGVMPADFGFPRMGTDAWCLPGFEAKRVSRGSHFLQSVGRLKPGVRLSEAQSEMDLLAADLNRQDGGFEGVRLVGLQEQTVGNARRSLLVLWIGVTAVLMIACANVAGLLLARAVARQKETALRSALGGSRARLIRQFLTESVLLAMIGGSVGLLLAEVVGRFVVTASAGSVPRLREFAMDGRVLAFMGLSCLITGLLFGLAPALHVLRVDLNSALKGGGVWSRFSDRLRLRNILVVSEVTLAMVLLVSCGLLVKTLWRLQHVDTGFQPGSILSFRFSVPNGKFNSDQRAELYQRVADRLAAVPGVESVGAINDLPFNGSISSSTFQLEGHPTAAGKLMESDYRVVSPDYLRTMRIRLVAGREFTVHDNHQSAPAMIVSQAFVRKYLQGEKPLGQHLRISGSDIRYEIVGVIADVKHHDLAAPGTVEMYVPYLQASPPNWIFFAVRTRIEDPGMVAAIRSAVREIAPTTPINRISPLSQELAFSISPQRFTSLLLSIFAGLALVLAAIGIYGVIAYGVAQRTKEIGVRMALGADRGNVLALILRQAGRIAGFGFLGGILATFVATRALSSLLYGVTAYDPMIWATVTGSLLMVIMASSYIPARRATKVDPLIALRYE